ncbi:MAG TPA: stage III sporulation protein AF [Bacillales bacterium]|nr:stage III sporulation protein AF [Bacillales bacterium]
MDYITSWIKEIILLIMLAVVLELLLPNSSMQRYVRMVIGLLLLLALLKPVLSVFDTNVNEMFTAFAISPVLEDDQLKNAIKNKKKEIQASERAYIEKQMAVPLKKKVEKEVSGRFHMDVADVRVTLNNIKYGQAESNVKHVTVRLKKHVKGGGSRIKPVKPVTVDANQPPSEPSNQKSETISKIRHFLANQWQLPEKKISVVLEGGNGSGS